jgi:hypothetical protein
MPARNQETRPISASFFSPLGLGKKVEEKSRLYLGAAVPVRRGEASKVRAKPDGRRKKKPPRRRGREGKERKGMLEEGFGFGGWVGVWKAEYSKGRR